MISTGWAFVQSFPNGLYILCIYLNCVNKNYRKLTQIRHILACQSSMMGTNPSKRSNPLLEFSRICCAPRALFAVSMSPPKRMGWKWSVIDVTSVNVRGFVTVSVETYEGTYRCKCSSIEIISSWLVSLFKRIPRGIYIFDQHIIWIHNALQVRSNTVLPQLLQHLSTNKCYSCLDRWLVWKVNSTLDKAAILICKYIHQAIDANFRKFVHARFNEDFTPTYTGPRVMDGEYQLELQWLCCSYKRGFK